MGRFEHAFPFAAVAGQEAVKKALLLCAVNPSVGGVLLAGEKGTAKSTLIRGAAALIGDTELVELPLNITEDRLVGSIRLEAALQKRGRVFEPGLLQKADGGFLYADEVNLLPEHIVNILLEVSSTGENIVEREGISFRHPARFVLVGSMNPEEGRLRPHFADRFGLYVPVRGERDPETRALIIRRRLEYERDPLAFEERWAAETARLRGQVLAAQALLERVAVPERSRRLAAGLSNEGHCPGHRAELVLCQAARAWAALDGRGEATPEDLRAVAEYVLPHRLREPAALPAEADEWDRDQCAPENECAGSGEAAGCPDGGTSDGEPLCSEQDGPGAEDRWEEIRPLEQRLTLKTPERRTPLAPGEGKRLKVRGHTARGRYIRAGLPRGNADDLALDATLRAAASHPAGRGDLAVTVRPEDLRVKIREQRTGASILFLVDASGSMGAKRRMGIVKGAVLSLLSDAYEKRDTVGIVAFREHRADTLLPLTRSVERAERMLRELKTGGKTPLAQGLATAWELLKADRIRHPGALQYLVVVSDGRGNVPLRTEQPHEDALAIARDLRADGINSLVLDPEGGFMGFDMACSLAEALGGTYIKLHDHTISEVGQAVRGFVG